MCARAWITRWPLSPGLFVHSPLADCRKWTWPDLHNAKLIHDTQSAILVSVQTITSHPCFDYTWRLRIMAWHYQLEIERTLASAEGTHGAKLRHRRKRRRRRIGRPNDIRHHSSPTSHPHSHSTHPAVITSHTASFLLPCKKIIPSPRNLFEHTGQGTIGALMINGAMGGEPVNKSRQTVT